MGIKSTTKQNLKNHQFWFLNFFNYVMYGIIEEKTPRFI